MEKIIKRINDLSPEKTLKTIAQITLWFGIVVSTILFLIGLFVIIDDLTELWITDLDAVEGLLLLLPILIVLPTTLVIWASLRVSANISNSLKEINQKTK